jgi:hypothetical protein
VAVSYFDNGAPDSGDTYLADGHTEELNCPVLRDPSFSLFKLVTRLV